MVIDVFGNTEFSVLINFILTYDVVPAHMICCVCLFFSTSINRVIVDLAKAINALQ